MLSSKFTASTKLFMIMKNLNLFLLGWMALMAFAQVGCSSEERLSGTQDTKMPLNVNIHSGLYTRSGGGG